MKGQMKTFKFIFLLQNFYCFEFPLENCLLPLQEAVCIIDHYIYEVLTFYGMEKWEM